MPQIINIHPAVSAPIGDLVVAASTESILLCGHAKPYNEPVVLQGPFVMNAEEEIMQAYKDYQQGKFGSWNF